MRRGKPAAMLLLLLASCSSVMVPARVWAPSPSTPPPTPTATPAKVVLLNGSANTPSTRAMAERLTDGFLRDLPFVVSEFVVLDDTWLPGLEVAIQKLQPAAIFALGRQAAELAQERFAQVPLVYTLVVEDAAHPIAGPQIAGVSVDVPAAAEFLMYKLVLGDLKNVVSYYTPGPGEAAAKALQEELKPLNVNLQLVPLDLRHASKVNKSAHLDEADALWLFNDPGLMTRQGFRVISTAAKGVNKPLLCSSFRQFADAGAMLTFSLNFENMGAQAAVLISEVIERHAFSGGPGLRPPVGGNLVLNARVAQELGIVIAADAKPFISEIIAEN